MDNPEKVRHYKERFRQDKPMAHRYYNLKHKNKDKMRMTAGEFGSWYDNEPKKCFYCDIPFDQLGFNNKYFNYRGSYNPFTIDRKKPSGDYSLENIVLACPLCNLIKSNFFSADTMRELAQRYIKPRWQQEAGIKPSAITPDELQPKIEEAKRERDLVWKKVIRESHISTHAMGEIMQALKGRE